MVATSPGNAHGGWFCKNQGHFVWHPLPRRDCLAIVCSANPFGSPYSIWFSDGGCFLRRFAVASLKQASSYRNRAGGYPHLVFYLERSDHIDIWRMLPDVDARARHSLTHNRGRVPVL